MDDDDDVYGMSAHAAMRTSRSIAHEYTDALGDVEDACTNALAISSLPPPSARANSPETPHDAAAAGGDAGVETLRFLGAGGVPGVRDGERKEDRVSFAVYACTLHWPWRARLFVSLRCWKLWCRRNTSCDYA